MPEATPSLDFVDKGTNKFSLHFDFVLPLTHTKDYGG